MDFEWDPPKAAANFRKHGVTFEKIEDYKTTVVALLHPSLRHANLRHRRYGNTSGSDAELAMLRDGIAATDVLKS